MTNKSPGPGELVVSINTYKISASSSTSTVVRTMRRLSRCCGLCNPGVSSKAICAPGACTTPRILVLVVCGLSETMAIFCSSSRLSNVDLPTLGRPIIATVPNFIMLPAEPFLSWRWDQLIHSFTFTHVPELFTRQLLDFRWVMFQTINVPSKRTGRPLQLLNICVQPLGVLTHGEVARQTHIAKDQHHEQQQTHGNSDIMGARHYATPPIQPLPSTILLDDHCRSLTINIARAQIHGHDRLHFDPALPRSGGAGYTWLRDPFGTAIRS